jgi:hypothetical protein
MRPRREGGDLWRPAEEFQPDTLITDTVPLQAGGVVRSS